MNNHLNDLYIPEFTPFLRQARNETCKELTVNNIIIEILGGQYTANSEVHESFKGLDILIEGENAVVIRYRREKDKKSYPAMVMGYDLDEKGGIIIRHIQGTKQKRVSHRFSSGFDSLKFFIELIKKNFTEKGIRVNLPNIPTNLEGASYGSSSIEMYNTLRWKLDNLNESI